MGRIKTELRNSGWLYCFKRGDKAVFLNRKDQVIKEFNSYKEAERFADNNMHLIDAKTIKIVASFRISDFLSFLCQMIKIPSRIPFNPGQPF